MKLVFKKKSQEVDVVIFYSGLGSNFLSGKVFSGVSHQIVAALRGDGERNTIYLSTKIGFLFIKFFHRAFRGLPALPFLEKLKLFTGNILRVYQLATILSFRPKAVITMIDTSFDYQWISRQVADPKFYAIANSPRDETHILDELPCKLPHPAGVFHIPNYFVYGKHEEAVFKKHRQEIGRYIHVGPLRYGYFLSELLSQKTEPIFDICLISQYVPKIVEHGDLPEVAENLRLLHEHLGTLIRDSNYKLVVALRTNATSEIDYFNDIFDGNVAMQANSFRHMSTYQIMHRSRLTVSHSSSAAQHAFGSGRKVLFTNYSSNKLLSFFAKGPWLDESGDYQTFSARVDELLDMSDADWLKASAKARHDFMTFDIEQPAHKRIRSEIENVLRLARQKV
jgi:surface carbohydrate biosynthesis protein